MKNRILITGVVGSIGSELARQLCIESTVYGVDINESGIHDIRNELGIFARVGDIRNKETVNDVFSDFKPHIVYHAAAYKHVPLMEELPEEAIQTNIIGTMNLLRYSRIYPVKKFIFISSDKAVNPKTIMGGTKMLGELMTRNSGKGYIAVRFGNVLGSRGSLIPIWQKQWEEGKKITVTDVKMERYFMSIEDAVGLVIEAGKIGYGGEVICWDMGKRVNILELAKKIVAEKDIEIIGIRPGEQLVEEIMTVEERQRAVKKGNFYIIK